MSQAYEVEGLGQPGALLPTFEALRAMMVLDLPLQFVCVLLHSSRPEAC